MATVLILLAPSMGLFFASLLDLALRASQGLSQDTLCVILAISTIHVLSSSSVDEFVLTPSL